MQITGGGWRARIDGDRIDACGDTSEDIFMAKIFVTLQLGLISRYLKDRYLSTCLFRSLCHFLWGCLSFWNILCMFGQLGYLQSLRFLVLLCTALFFNPNAARVHFKLHASDCRSSIHNSTGNDRPQSFGPTPFSQQYSHKHFHKSS